MRIDVRLFLSTHDEDSVLTLNTYNSLQTFLIFFQYTIGNSLLFQRVTIEAVILSPFIVIIIISYKHQN